MKTRSSLFLMLLVLADCSDSTMTSPTAHASSSAGGVSTSKPRSLNDPTASWTMSGPTGLDGRCLGPADVAALPFNEFIWTLTVRDAGEAGILRFKMMAFHSDAPGCQPTIENPRERIKQPGGQAGYPPHGSGSTTFAAPANEWTCGRSQFDIETEEGVLLVGLVVDYGSVCTSTLPHDPVPSPIPIPIPIPTPVPVFCPADNDLFIGEPRWTAVGTRVIVDFLLKPDLKNVQLSLASYESINPPSLFPQRLLGATTGTFTGSGSMSIIAASCSAQLDLLRCGPPIVEWPTGVEPAAWWTNDVCAGLRK